MLNTTAIRTAIAELLEGTIGSVRHMATSEYLSVAANAFTSWTPTGCSVVADQAYGADGQETADSVAVTTGDQLAVALGTIADDTVVDYSVYAWTEAGTTTMTLTVVRKDGTTASGSSETVTTTKTKFSLSDVDVRSGATPAAVRISFSGNSATVYLAEAHVTSDDYLFGKIDQWDDAIVESTIEPDDGKLQVNARYDTTFPSVTQHASSPVSAIGSHKLDELDIQIMVTYKLDSNVQEDIRDSTRERVLYIGDRIIQALHYPNNLDQTADAVATGIVSGMLYDLTLTIEAEAWDETPPRIVSVIRGKAAIHNTQLTG